MKSRNRGILLAAITSVIFPTAALPASGGAKLSAWCDSSAHGASSGRGDYRRLVGYVQGATDAMIAHQEACPPADAKVEHGVDIVCRYVANNRQQWSASKYLLTKNALAQAFPCSNR